MPVGTLSEARTIAHDVAAILEPLIAELEQRADRALKANRVVESAELRRRREELSRQADRLREI